MNSGMRFAVRAWRGAMGGRGMASQAGEDAVVERYANTFVDLLRKVVPGTGMGAMVAQIRDAVKVAEDKQFIAALENPTLPKEVKVDVCRALAERAKFSPYVTNLMMLTAENGRGSSLAPILQKSLALLSGESSGELEVIFTTAEKLSKYQMVLLQNNLQQMTRRVCKIKTVIDPSLLSGMTIQIGDQLMDRSAKNEIQKLKALLQTT